jgi:hypothetical protein
MNNKENDERKFLHDISSPMGTALLLADSLLENMKNRPDVSPDELAQIGRINEVLEIAGNMIHERRQVLIQRGVPSSKP